VSDAPFGSPASSTGAPTPTPAATVVPLRDGDAGLEVLLLQRNGRGQFGRMWVFPGGQVDEGDHAGVPRDRTVSAYIRGDRPNMAAARRAAVREAREEAGLDLDEQTLVTLSFWMPPTASPKRFATWFFLAPAAPNGAVRVDRTEIHDHRWLTPAAAIAARDAGDITLAPPTFMTLWWLSRCETPKAAMDAAAARVPERFETRIAGGGEGPATALWEGDAGYHDFDVDRPGPRRRAVLDPAGWRVEVES
jgi:8-oxo-dGTP pyrophosphatase MutT (NUDIX family)